MDQIAVGIIFFAAYGWAAFAFMRWLARARVAGVSAPEGFKRSSRVLAFGGILALALLPPLFELLSRLALHRQSSDLEFFAFVGAWIASALPGCISGRRILKAGGIDPDA